MQHQSFSRPPAAKPVTIEVDGEPLGVVVPSAEGYRFLAVRFSAFALDGQTFGSVEEARSSIGAALHAEAPPG
ncbi:MAG: hypothetical protein EOP22_12755 [Hyphomicrobiales bacterium]|nr:MAG: hypothetical protein EOP22_12755 [Hyphomicrobiales bacterium]